ncbi:MAG: bifunctional pyr operon transcriptional regulator/uracil phosphoribosyltransferase PyrR [Myxococcales bacterium]|nr:bifunctional pyr operon transcriptional regulator/uracil phosphoribosyltransferase PyrR [Myxococcales bacterium]
MDSEAVAKSVGRIAVAMMAQIPASEHLALVGIRRGGVDVAKSIIAHLREKHVREFPLGTVDISLYRDDAATTLPSPKIGPSHIPFSIEGKDIVLVDDVLHTGRTVRAAIECLLDYGRPRRIWLAALCDRGQRELPISPDFVGMTLNVPAGTQVRARFGAPEGPCVVLRNRVAS